MKFAFLTGAGISQGSGIKTFRDPDGHWNCRDWQKLASLDGWNRTPEAVLEFYNDRRKDVEKASPNYAHKRIAEFQKKYPDTVIITQNVDDLHERAGSTNVNHIHGIINQAKTERTGIVVKQTTDLKLGDTVNGEQLRPNVVWFGEDVPNYDLAAESLRDVDALIVIGTSLKVYPAANLLDEVSNSCMTLYLDPSEQDDPRIHHGSHLKKTACDGIDELLEIVENLEKTRHTALTFLKP